MKVTKAHRKNGYFEEVDLKDSDVGRKIANNREAGESEGRGDLADVNVSNSYFFLMSRQNFKEKDKDVDAIWEHSKANSSKEKKKYIEGIHVQMSRGSDTFKSYGRNSQGDMESKLLHDLSQFGISGGGKENMFEEAIRNMEARDLDGKIERKAEKNLLS